jgi:hypothetical protein
MGGIIPEISTKEMNEFECLNIEKVPTKLRG